MSVMASPALLPPPLSKGISQALSRSPHSSPSCAARWARQGTGMASTKRGSPGWGHWESVTLPVSARHPGTRTTKQPVAMPHKKTAQKQLTPIVATFSQLLHSRNTPWTKQSLWLRKWTLAIRDLFLAAVDMSTPSGSGVSGARNKGIRSGWTLMAGTPARTLGFSSSRKTPVSYKNVLSSPYRLKW